MVADTMLTFGNQAADEVEVVADTMLTVVAAGKFYTKAEPLVSDSASCQCYRSCSVVRYRTCSETESHTIHATAAVELGPILTIRACEDRETWTSTMNTPKQSLVRPTQVHLHICLLRLILAGGDRIGLLAPCFVAGMHPTLGNTLAGYDQTLG